MLIFYLSCLSNLYLAPKKDTMEISHESLWMATMSIHSFSSNASLAKLMPRIGSGSSDGMSSTGRLTAHFPLGNPYRHKFSLSANPPKSSYCLYHHQRSQTNPHRKSLQFASDFLKFVHNFTNVEEKKNGKQKR